MDYKEYQFAVQQFAVYDEGVEFSYLALGLISEVMELHKSGARKRPWYVKVITLGAKFFLSKEGQLNLSSALDNYFIDFATADTLDEIGDIMWFVAQTCTYYRVNMAEIMDECMGKQYPSLMCFVDDYAKLTAKYLRGDFQQETLEHNALLMVGTLANTLSVKLLDKSVWLRNVCHSNVEKLIERKKKRILRTASITDQTVAQRLNEVTIRTDAKNN